MSYTYRIILEADEGGYHAYVPALPGCHTWGKTISGARVMARDAIDTYLRSLVADGEEIPVNSELRIGDLLFFELISNAPPNSK